MVLVSYGITLWSHGLDGMIQDVALMVQHWEEVVVKDRNLFFPSTVSDVLELIILLTS